MIHHKNMVFVFWVTKLWAIWELRLLFRWLSWDISAATHTIHFFRWRFGTAWPLAFIYGVGKLNRITRCEVILAELARQIAYIGYLVRMNQRWRPPLTLRSLSVRVSRGLRVWRRGAPRWKVGVIPRSTHLGSSKKSVWAWNARQTRNARRKNRSHILISCFTWFITK